MLPEKAWIIPISALKLDFAALYVKKNISTKL